MSAANIAWMSDSSVFCFLLSQNLTGHLILICALLSTPFESPFAHGAINMDRCRRWQLMAYRAVASSTQHCVAYESFYTRSVSVV